MNETTNEAPDAATGTTGGRPGVNERRWTAIRVAPAEGIPGCVDTAGTINVESPRARVEAATGSASAVGDRPATVPAAIAEIEAAKRPTLTLTQKFFVEGEAAEARQWEGSPLLRDDGDKESPAFGSFDRVPRRWAPAWVAALCGVTALGAGLILSGARPWRPTGRERGAWRSWTSPEPAMAWIAAHPLTSQALAAERSAGPTRIAVGSTRSPASEPSLPPSSPTPSARVDRPSSLPATVAVTAGPPDSATTRNIDVSWDDAVRVPGRRRHVHGGRASRARRGYVWSPSRQDLVPVDEPTAADVAVAPAPSGAVHE